MKILIKIGIGASVALNLFIIGLTSYVWLNSEKKFNENREWLRGEIKDEVYRQIKIALPDTTGTVKR